VVAHHHPGTAARPGRHRLEVRNGLITSWLRRPARTALRHTVDALRGLGEPETRSGVTDACLRLPQVLASRRVLPAEVERLLWLLER
jgi:hypothetical protein